MNGLKFDGTINLPVLITLCAALVGIGGWMANVSNKLDTVAQLVVNSADMGKRLDRLEQQIVLNRTETLKNRQVYLSGEGEK